MCQEFMILEFLIILITSAVVLLCVADALAQDAQ